MAEFRIFERYEPATEMSRESLMDGVWQQMRTVGMMWGAVMDGNAALAGYERALRQGCRPSDAAERALSYFAGPRVS